MSERTAVYRVFDASDGLLYIGVAKNFGLRWAKHAAVKPWWPDVQRQTVEWYPDRESALAAEEAAIRTEKPRHNVVYTPQQYRRPRPASKPCEIAHIVGSAEIQHMLSVSRQRVQQVVNGGDFPAPLDVLAMGKVWHTDDIRAWAAARGRELQA